MIHPEVARMLEGEQAARAQAHLDGRKVLEARIMVLELSLRDILSQAERANPDGEDELLAFIAGTAREGLRKPDQK